MSKEKKTAKQHSKEWFEALLIALLFATVIRVFLVESYRIPTSSMEKTLLAGDFLFVNKFVYGAKVPFTDIRLPGIDTVERNDIIVFKFPKDRSLNYIKRCVAISGDTLEIKNRVLYINGEAVPLPENGQFLAESMPAGYPDNQLFPRYAGFNKDNYGPLRIPQRGDVVQLNEESYYRYAELAREEGHSIKLRGEEVFLDGKPADTYTVEENYFFVMGDNRDNSLDSRFWGFLPERDLVGQALMVYWSWDPDISLMELGDKLGTIRWSRMGLMVH